ncbi:DUF2815 family protein [Bacillus sp. FSL K6-3431]|uniref:DUF2815 family protein n=1 Tax=Bacillus sp. FSL K6-3431 TaxID=2921500 RepID=UPI0030F4D264
MAKINGTKVTTNEVRMSYAQVFEPKAMEGSTDEKYSIALLIPKTDTETIDFIEQAIATAAEEGKAKFGGKVPAKLKTTFRDGDEEKPDDEAYVGHYFLNCSSKTKPGVIKVAAPGSSVKFEKIEDESEFYSGCYGKAVINFFAYNAQGNKGVSAGLNNLLKTRDGEAFAGKAAAEDDFADEYEDDGESNFLD